VGSPIAEHERTTGFPTTTVTELSTDEIIGATEDRGRGREGGRESEGRGRGEEEITADSSDQQLRVRP
jgi:hypothetical protein